MDSTQHLFRVFRDGVESWSRDARDIDDALAKEIAVVSSGGTKEVCVVGVAYPYLNERRVWHRPEEPPEDFDHERAQDGLPQTSNNRGTLSADYDSGYEDGFADGKAQLAADLAARFLSGKEWDSDTPAAIAEFLRTEHGALIEEPA